MFSKTQGKFFNKQRLKFLRKSKLDQILIYYFYFFLLIVLSLKETSRRALYHFIGDKDDIVDGLNIPTSLKSYLKDLTWNLEFDGEGKWS